jgi:hypothetical protein
MNTDAYYEIGSSHQVCEDYTLSGIYDGMAYTVVSDGCSSSKNSDVGARLLSHIAKGVLYYLKDRNFICSPEFYPLFKELTIKKCLEVKHSLGLPFSVFDATLLISVVLDGQVLCHGWGDGYFIFVTKEDSKMIIESKYESNAPYYLSYEMDGERKKAYTEQYGDSKNTINTYEITPEGQSSAFKSEIYLSTDNRPFCANFFTTFFKSITATSDGIDTYEDNPKYDLIEGSSGHKKYSAIDMIPSIVGYKGTAGEFVVRRMQRLKNDMTKINRVHFDDISCATITL